MDGVTCEEECSTLHFRALTEKESNVTRNYSVYQCHRPSDKECEYVKLDPVTR